MQDKFDLQGDPIDVDKAVATQCGRRISNYTYKLKKKYDKLVKAKGAEYARSNPPGGVKPEQWTSLIDKKWNDKKWQVISCVHIKIAIGSSCSILIFNALKTTF